MSAFLFWTQCAPSLMSTTSARVDAHREASDGGKTVPGLFFVKLDRLRMEKRRTGRCKRVSQPTGWQLRGPCVLYPDPGAAASLLQTRRPAFEMRDQLSRPILPIVRSCLCGGRTIKGVKTAWLGNAVAMMHYLRIVNSGGRQKWHGHDHKDEAHATLPIWRGLAQQQYARLEGRSMLPLKWLRARYAFRFSELQSRHTISDEAVISFARLTIAVSTYCHWTRDAEPRRPSVPGLLRLEKLP